MGNELCSNCKKNSNIDVKSQEEFQTIEEKVGDNSETVTNSMCQGVKLKSNKPNLTEEQKQIEAKLNEYGIEIENKKIDELIYERNKNVTNDALKINELEMIEHQKEDSNLKTFKSPPIQFKKDGSIYLGDWNINSQKNGFGIYINPKGAIYKGIYKNDYIDNYGIFIDEKGNYYKGNLKNGKEEGNGELFIKNKFKYNGGFSNDTQNGIGIEENLIDGSIYEGNFVNGCKTGKGKLIFKDGTIYEGNFKNGKFDGNGKINYIDGRVYEGEFKNNMMNGKGVFKWKDGEKYIGNYLNNLKHGFGKYEYNSNQYYEGFWVNNKQHGKGLYYLNGKKLNGLFRYGKIIMKKN